MIADGAFALALPWMRKIKCIFRDRTRIFTWRLSFGVSVLRRKPKRYYTTAACSFARRWRCSTQAAPTPGPHVTLHPLMHGTYESPSLCPLFILHHHPPTLSSRSPGWLLRPDCSGSYVRGSHDVWLFHGITNAAAGATRSSDDP